MRCCLAIISYKVPGVNEMDELLKHIFFFDGYIVYVDGNPAKIEAVYWDFASM